MTNDFLLLSTIQHSSCSIVDFVDCRLVTLACWTERMLLFSMKASNHSLLKLCWLYNMLSILMVYDAHFISPKMMELLSGLLQICLSTRKRTDCVHLCSAEQAMKFPVLTFASGPTNSMRGAAFLSKVSDAIVIDIGGTTTDVGMIRNGFPREASSQVKVRTTDMLSVVLSVAIVNIYRLVVSVQTSGCQMFLVLVLVVAH